MKMIYSMPVKNITGIMRGKLQANEINSRAYGGIMQEMVFIGIEIF